MTIQVKDVAMTYVENNRIDIVLFNNECISFFVYDTDLIEKTSVDECFFDDQGNVDWVLNVGYY